MNKAELIEKISADAGISKKKACSAIDILTNIIAGTLAKGRKLNMIGLGIFSVSKRAARNGRNPQTGAVLSIREKKTLKFKAGPELSDKLNRDESQKITIHV